MVILERRTLVCRVGYAICGPHRCDVPNRGHGKQTETQGLRFQGRTCISGHCVCDIWGTAELQAHNILISFFGPDVFSIGRWRWRPLTWRLNNLHIPSERGTPCKMHWGREKERSKQAEGGCEWEKREMKAHTLSGWVELQYMHVDLGFHCPCVKKRQRSPLRFYLPTWFTAPVTYNEKRKWASMMKYIITTHFKTASSGTVRISQSHYLCTYVIFITLQ